MLVIITEVSELRALINNAKAKNKSIGFVPTMGALHDGHVSLARKCKRESDLSIVSIFVNPTQFNDKTDLKKYPRNLEADSYLLINAKIDCIFAPSVEEMYPNGMSVGTDIDLGGLDMYMEGAFRPGHFKGMAQVVKRLLDIVTPDRLYMGQKDFQQFTIVNYFIKNLDIKTELVICKIIREQNGLARSSRNERLSPETRAKAGIIYQTLKSVKRKSKNRSISYLETSAMDALNYQPFLPEYFTIVDGTTLLPVENMDNHSYVVACTAVWADGVRLIDNHILKGGK